MQTDPQDRAALIERARAICAKHDLDKDYQYLDGSRDDYPTMRMVIEALQSPSIAEQAGDEAARAGAAGVAQVPPDVAARQLVGLFYELSGSPDMAAEVRSDSWEQGSGFGPGSERAMLGVMAAMISAVRKEFAAFRTTPAPSTDAMREALISVAQVAETAPELNMSNYDQDDVKLLNNLMIEIVLVTRAALSPTKDRESSTDIDGAAIRNPEGETL